MSLKALLLAVLVVYAQAFGHGSFEKITRQQRSAQRSSGSTSLSAEKQDFGGRNSARAAGSGHRAYNSRIKEILGQRSFQLRITPEFQRRWRRMLQRDHKIEQAKINYPYKFIENEANIKAAIKQWQQHVNDTGSSAVQAAIANERIKYLTTHLLQNKKDQAAKRGLEALVNFRRRHVNYLMRQDRQLAGKLVKELGFRYQDPRSIKWNKELKYARFKNTKQGKKSKKVSLSIKEVKRRQMREKDQTKDKYEEKEPQTAEKESEKEIVIEQDIIVE